MGLRVVFSPSFAEAFRLPRFIERPFRTEGLKVEG